MKCSKHIVLGLMLIWCCSSCSTLFRTHSTYIESDPESEVYVRGVKQGTESASINLNSYGYSNIDLEIHKKGYKTRREILYPTKFNAGTFTSVFLGYFVFLELLSRHHMNYPRQVKYDLEAFPTTDGHINHVNLNSLELDSTLTHVSETYYSGLKRYASRTSSQNWKRNLLEDYSPWLSKKYANQYLRKLQVQDSSYASLTSYNDYNLIAKVKHAKNDLVKLYRTPNMTVTTVDIEYRFVDEWGRTVMDTVISAKSGRFFEHIPYEYLFFDALENNLIYLLKSKRVQHLLKTPIEPDDLEAYASFSPSAPLNFKRLDRYVYKSNYTYTNEDEEEETDFIPVFPISNEGHWAISLPFVDEPGKDSVRLISPEGDTLMAHIEKKLPKMEYAVLKTKETVDAYFKLGRQSDDMKHQQAYLLGFEHYFDSFHMSQVTVSAIRKVQHKKLLQFDNGSSHLSFPALISKEGELLGFTSSSLKTYSVSNLSFCSKIE